MKLYDKKQALTIGTGAVMIIVFALLSSCGRELAQGPKGDSGTAGAQGYGAGILTQKITGLCGNTDGIRLTTFQDKNNNGLLDPDETINSVTSVCNGSNGQNGQNGKNGANGTSSTMSISTVAPLCGMAGGYTMTVFSEAVTSSYPICNGIAGLNGLSGTDGSTVTPIKFCSSDHSQFPEYGLDIGGHIFAVYWGSTPSSNVSQAFLAELLPGSYMSTGGNNCAFSIL